MTALIRDMAALVEALRAAQIERDISCHTLDDLAGFATGTTAKYLGPAKSKGIGPVSLGLLLGALGKGLVLIDDEEQIDRVKNRWAKRKLVGAAIVQMRGQASRASMQPEIQNKADLQAKLELQERMKELSKLGASKGGKRRALTMKKRARQRQASHAARIRWAKQKPGAWTA